MASTSTPEVIFVTNKPRLRSHNKSRGGCSTCKARKVKCPENRPICRTCARRGEICVYADRFRGLNPNARQDYTKEASERKTPARVEDDEQSSSDEHSAKNRVPHKIDDQSGLASLRDLIHTSPPKQLNWNDQDDLQVINSCTFYNSVVVIHIAPAHAPFQRIEIPVDVWRYFLPKALQHTWIALMKSMQAIKAGVDPLAVREVCQYRGSGLRELTKALPDVANDPYGMVLSSVMTMMTADLYTGGPWTLHLEAARRILILKGGFKACFESTPTLRRLLFNYLVADTYSGTMCNSKLISETCSEMHADYVEVLDDNDQDVFACSRPCPRQLKQAIVRVNMLRASRGRGDSNEHINFERQALSDIITTFEPASWAISASDYGRTLPQRPEDCLAERDVTALSSYASCYQSATQLYFLLSCATPLNHQDRLRTHIASQTLSQHVRSLFESATNDSEGPLHSQLWKLLSWPILVGTYVRAGWDIGEEGVQIHLERLRKIAKVFGSTRAFDAAKLVRRVADQRARCSAADWKWDDGFYSRSAFAL